MMATNYSVVRNNFKDYCDKVCKTDDVLVITRRDGENVVLMSLDSYNKMERAMKYVFYSAALSKPENADTEE